MNGFTNSENPVRYMEHPLQNSLILDNVFGYDTSAKSVQRNHLVWKSWHEANYNRWLELPTFLVPCYHPQHVSKTSARKPLMDLAEFYHHFKAGHPKITRMLTTPLYCMELHGWELFSGDLSLHDLDSWFWSLTITSALTKLSLSNCRFAQHPWIYQKHLLEKLPNLETLAIKNGIIHPVHKISQTETEQQRMYSGYSLSRLRNLEISVTFTSPMETPTDIPFHWWLVRLTHLTNLKITLSNYPHELPKYLLRALIIREKCKSLVYFDLLDFSKVAHDFKSEMILDDSFSNLEFVAMDLGYGPEKHSRKIDSVRKLVLYRAPFQGIFSGRLTCRIIHELEVYGNVAPDMELKFLTRPFSLKKLVWNTRCYDNQHKGKRIQHLLNDKQKAYPLFTFDLVERAKKLFYFDCMYHLDIDFGPLSEESWARLGQHAKGLMTLKAVFGKDHDLLLVSRIWPQLMMLEIKHRSRVSLSALMKILPNMTKLRKFCWKACACTSLYFTEVKLLREMENLAHARWKNNVELPWKWDGKTLVKEELCLEAEFENKLLAAAQV